MCTEMRIIVKIIKDITEIEKLHMENTAVALGKFDGVHRGHRNIMEKLIREKTKGYTSLVFTFSRNPKTTHKNISEEKIFTEKEQMLVYEKTGIDIIIVYPINSGILNMSAEAFVKNILVDRLGVKKIICGENFRFGKDRLGDTDTLKRSGERYGFETEIVDMLSENGKIISSTVIRELIKEGKLEEAEKMLGHRFTIAGRVVYGNQIGRTLNTPTANIIPEKEKIIPPYGVYVSLCNIEGKYYRGVTNIGYKPTINEKEKQLGVETHFLDYSGNLYGKIIEIELVKHTRPEMKFDSTDDLKKQLIRDKENCRNVIIE